MRNSLEETATPIHQANPPSFWKGMILAAIVLVPSSQASAEDKRSCIVYKTGAFECAAPPEPHKDWGEYKACAFSEGMMSKECAEAMQSWGARGWLPPHE